MNLLADLKNPWGAEKKTPPTPFYLYSESRLKTIFESFIEGQSPSGLEHHFAMKSNDNPHVLQFFRKNGVGLDVVSGFEFKAALKQKFKPEQIVFSGVGKSNEEIEFAFRKGVQSLNVESSDELARAEIIAKRLKVKGRVAIRVNPDVNAKTHRYIATGLHEHKFGVDFNEARDLYLKIQSSKYLMAEGIGFHIGSQLFDLSSLEEAAEKTMGFVQSIQAESKIRLSVLDVGGGLGVDYQQPLKAPEFSAYNEFLNRVLQKWRATQGKTSCIYTECGRALVAQAGFLISRVIQTKSNAKKNFLILDASMTELIRPSLYQAWHPIESWNLAKQDRPKKTYDVVGPVCESGDFLGHARELTEPKADELFVISCAGAYGHVMASHYNGRPLPAEWFLPLKGQPIERRASVKKQS